jgi:hypothetical protein
MSDAVPVDVEKNFFRAVKRNELDVVASLLRAHPLLVGLYKQGCSAVGYACTQANFGVPQDFLAMVRLLIDAGVDVNARQNDGCLTPLHLMANANDAPSQVEIVRLLLERGADPAARESIDGATPLQQRPRPPAAVVGLIEQAGPLRRAWQAAEAARREAEAAAAAAEPEPEHQASADDASLPGQRTHAEILDEEYFRGLSPAKALMQAIKWGRPDAVAAALAAGGAGLPNSAEACSSSTCPVDYACLLSAYASPAPAGADQAHLCRAECEPGVSILHAVHFD